MSRELYQHKLENTDWGGDVSCPDSAHTNLSCGEKCNTKPRDNAIGLTCVVLTAVGEDNDVLTQHMLWRHLARIS